jgi:hypothetical protein
MNQENQNNVAAFATAAAGLIEIAQATFKTQVQQIEAALTVGDTDEDRELILQATLKSIRILAVLQGDAFKRFINEADILAESRTPE